VVDLGGGFGNRFGCGNRFGDRLRLGDGGVPRRRGGVRGLRCRLRGELRRGLGLPDQALALSLAPDPVRLGILDRRGMALHADAERQREVEGLLVREAELSRELVDADLPSQVPDSPFSQRR
jgi:hypothetical protein